MVLGHADDSELIGRMRDGDKQALAEVYRRYGRVVLALALQITGDAALAEEILQEVMLRAWRTADRFDSSRGRVATWLFLITRSLALDAVRDRRKAPALYVVAPPEPPDLEEAAALSLLQEQVRTALQSLESEQRRAIEMAYFQGLTHHEIAQRTQAPLGTVKSRLRLALQHLRRLLAGPMEKEGKTHGRP